MTSQAVQGTWIQHRRFRGELVKLANGNLGACNINSTNTLGNIYTLHLNRIRYVTGDINEFPPLTIFRRILTLRIRKKIIWLILVIRTAAFTAFRHPWNRKIFKYRSWGYRLNLSETALNPILPPVLENIRRALRGCPKIPTPFKFLHTEIILYSFI